MIDSSRTILLLNSVTYKYKHGLLHCEDGPAIIKPDGVEYWLEGKCYEKPDFERLINLINFW